MGKQRIFSLTKDDFEFHTFRSGGKGGQHQNKTDSGVRIVHKATGLSAEARESRSQHVNKKTAFERLCENPKFKIWLKIESMRSVGLIKSEAQIKGEIDEQVERDLKNGNIKIEYTKEKSQYNL